MRGKYSPTVTAAYMADQEWWDNYTYSTIPDRESVYIQYDPEGYDSYGYNKDDIDRAGNNEYEYSSNDDENDCNWKYDHSARTWSFDGVKPVKK